MTCALVTIGALAAVLLLTSRLSGVGSRQQTTAAERAAAITTGDTAAGAGGGSAPVIGGHRNAGAVAYYSSSEERRGSPTPNSVRAATAVSSAVLACGSPSSCELVEPGLEQGSPAAGHAYRWAMSDGPGRALVQSAGYMSCGSKVSCVLLAARSAGGVTQPLWTTSAGHTWTWAQTPGVSPARVSCVTAEVCFAFGPSGGSEAFIGSDDRGKNWTWVNDLPLPERGTFTGSLSCGGPQSCLVVGRTQHYLVIVATQNGGRSWFSAADRSHFAWRRDAGLIPGALSCPSASSCQLILTKPGAAEGLVWRTVDGGRSWQETKLRGLQGASLSCVSDRDCILVRHRSSSGQDARAIGSAVLKTQDFGARWTQVAELERYVVRYLDCPTAASCVALATPTRGGGPSVTFTTADGGVRWRRAGLRSGE